MTCTAANQIIAQQKHICFMWHLYFPPWTVSPWEGCFSVVLLAILLSQACLLLLTLGKRTFWEQLLFNVVETVAKASCHPCILITIHNLALSLSHPLALTLSVSHSPFPSISASLSPSVLRSFSPSISCSLFNLSFPLYHSLQSFFPRVSIYFPVSHYLALCFALFSVFLPVLLSFRSFSPSVSISLFPSVPLSLSLALIFSLSFQSNHSPPFFHAKLLIVNTASDMTTQPAIRRSDPPDFKLLIGIHFHWSLLNKCPRHSTVQLLIFSVCPMLKSPILKLFVGPSFQAHHRFVCLVSVLPSRMDQKLFAVNLAIYDPEIGSTPMWMLCFTFLLFHVNELEESCWMSSVCISVGYID